MNKKVMVIIILVVAGAIFWFAKSKPSAPVMTETINQNQSASAQDSIDISGIKKDIESIDVGTPTQEFKDINNDLKGL